ncbi:MAG: hypothetical protein WBC18_25180 [Ottowia sp.]|uniref:hypothetical protein n=1 Tax=unclassified Ottowia TaxID=2645081 RepID=UPI003C2FC979
MNDTPAKPGLAPYGAPSPSCRPAGDTAPGGERAAGVHARHLPGPLLPEWKALMRRGMNADRGRAPEQAQALYLLARDIAQTLLEGSADPMPADDRVAAFVVTHLNLSDSFSDAGQPEAAVPHLCSAHRKLIALLVVDGVASDLRQAAWRHSRETHAALIQHLSEYGDHPDIMAALHTGCIPMTAPETPAH